MDDEIYPEFVRYLAMPGKLSGSAWRDAYLARQRLESGKEEAALFEMIGVLSRVARSRRERLPDNLHNMMMLNSGGVQGHCPEYSKRQVQSYVKMLKNIG